MPKATFITFTDSTKQFRNWFDDLLNECWAACQEGTYLTGSANTAQETVANETVSSADVIIESPTAFAGIHVAEALGQ